MGICIQQITNQQIADLWIMWIRYSKNVRHISSILLLYRTHLCVCVCFVFVIYYDFQIFVRHMQSRSMFTPTFHSQIAILMIDVLLPPPQNENLYIENLIILCPHTKPNSCCSPALVLHGQIAIFAQGPALLLPSLHKSTCLPGHARLELRMADCVGRCVGIILSGLQ